MDATEIIQNNNNNKPSFCGSLFQNLYFILDVDLYNNNNNILKTTCSIVNDTSFLKAVNR